LTNAKLADAGAGEADAADVMGTKALQMRYSDNIATGSGAQTATMVQQVIILLYVLETIDLSLRGENLCQTPRQFI